MTTLIIATHDNQKLAASTRHAVQAASLLGKVHVLIAGENVTVAEDAARLRGVEKVLLCQAPHYRDRLPEEIAPLAVSLSGSYDYIAAPADSSGKSLIPRIAAMADIPQISDIVAIKDAHTFVRPIYAGNALATVSCSEKTLALTFRMTAFDEADNTETVASIETVPSLPPQNLSRFVEDVIIKTERPELTQAEVVVSGGRALGSTENFDAVLLPLADKLGAAVGASRAAVDAGYASNDAQVGQTGKVVAPKLYIAVGISGAIQHLAGMQDSKVIVAINKDPDAPIFKAADYGIIGDLFEVVPELTHLL